MRSSSLAEDRTFLGFVISKGVFENLINDFRELTENSHVVSLYVKNIHLVMKLVQ